MALARFGNYEWIHGYFKGDDVYIVASGPSVKDDFEIDGKMDFSALDGKRKIVISHVLNFIPNPDIMVVLDANPLDRLGRDHYNKPYKTVTGPNTNLEPQGQVAVCRMISPNSELTKNAADGIFSRMSSGHAAIHVAILGQAKNIYLIGFDCNVTGESGNFYNTKEVKGYARDNPGMVYPRMLDGFNKFKGLDNIYNLSQSSSISVFKKMKFKDIKC